MQKKTPRPAESRGVGCLGLSDGTYCVLPKGIATKTNIPLGLHIKHGFKGDDNLRITFKDWLAYCYGDCCRYGSNLIVQATLQQNQFKCTFQVGQSL